MIDIEYAIVFALVAFFSSTVATYLIDKILKKYGRPSILSLLVGITFGLSAIAVLFNMENKIIESENLGVNVWSFNSACSNFN